MSNPQTMFEKIWNRHVIVTRGGSEALLHIYRNFVHEGSFHAFAALAKDGRKTRKPRESPQLIIFMSSENRCFVANNRQIPFFYPRT